MPKKKNTPISPMHKEHMKNLTLAVFYLSLVIQEYSSNYDQFLESALRFRRGTFVELDSKAMDAGLGHLNHTLFLAITALEDILKDLEADRDNERLPARKTIAAVYVVVGGVVAASKLLPNFGRIWRWHPDYEAYRYAMEPIEKIKAQEKVDNMFRYLGEISKFARD